MPGSVSDAVSIEELPTDRLGELAPLWNSLREHHLTVAPSWLPAAYDAEESWRRRERQYREWLADPDSFVLVARRDHGLVGYAMVHLRDGSPTWPTSERAGELETLSVLPEKRNAGGDGGDALAPNPPPRHTLRGQGWSLHPGRCARRAHDAVAASFGLRIAERRVGG
jgi:hypothetical protein